jgi:hypothetical protein
VKGPFLGGVVPVVRDDLGEFSFRSEDGEQVLNLKRGVDAFAE